MRSLTLLHQSASAIRSLATAAMDATQGQLDDLAEPPGLLGVLEDVAKRLAGHAEPAKDQVIGTHCAHRSHAA